MREWCTCLVELLHSGKVRDLYADGDDLILVASDRVSVYDTVLPTPIPDKGKLLTALSLWWFEQLADLVPNHVISATDVPAEFAGRAIRCRRLEMVPVECVARGYLTGGGLKEYESTGAVSGVELPRGLVEAAILPEPIFTPTTKAPVGEHDQPMTYAEVVEKVGAETAERLRQVTIEVYCRGAELAADRGILVADTKLERPTGRCSSATRCSLPTRRGSGRPSRTSRAARSSPTTSSTYGTGPPAAAGTGRAPRPRCPPRWWRPPGPATSRSTRGSPATAGSEPVSRAGGGRCAARWERSR